MILRDKPGPLQLAFAMRGSIVPAIIPGILFLAGVSAVMVWIQHVWSPFPATDGFAFTVFGIALSLFLGFRNNAAYDRWWEARKLWGGLLADLRSLAREAEIFIPSRELRVELLQLALAFIHLHRVNLRRIPDEGETGILVSELSNAAHPPCATLDRMAALIAKAHRSGMIDGYGARALDERLASIALQQAGCERIALTPLPYVYSLLIYRTTYLYCLLLPFALIGPAGWLTPLFVGIVAYVFLGLAEVTEDLSHPFGTTPNALPLDAICRAAEISLAPHLGQQPPQPLKAVNFYLS